jgi:WD40 repeat protein
MGGVQSFAYQEGKWELDATSLVTGHTDIITDLQFRPDQPEYLLTVSRDQTARVWHDTKEVMRSQVHGYDLQCATWIDSQRYICGSDGEKMMRVLGEGQGGVAALPALGLSNKLTDTTALPTTIRSEHDLHIGTLWPELDKLYGHGDDVYTLCTNHGRTRMLSSCILRASAVSTVNVSESEGSVRLWSLGDQVKEVLTLPRVHTMTVTRMTYSWDDQFAVMVGRDRLLSLWAVTDTGLELVKSVTAHARVIWDVGVSRDNQHIFTASRDKTVKMWDRQTLAGVATVKFDHAVTSLVVDVTRDDTVIVGLENGTVSLVTFSAAKQPVVKVILSSAASITRLALHIYVDSETYSQSSAGLKSVMSTGDPKKTLAIAAEDGSLRVIKI